MGDPKKQRKKYSRPKKPFDKARIEEEKEIIEKYGLKNKKEIWKVQAKIDRIRQQAKKLILADPAEQNVFKKRLVNLGLISADATIDDILALTKEKLFDRRLQTIVFKKKFAKTPKQARQFITHRKISLNNNIVNIPGYVVKADEEAKIKLIGKNKNKLKN